MPLELGRTPGPRLPRVQPGAVGGDLVWAPRTDRKSHSSLPGLGPGLGIGVKSHPLKEEPRPGGCHAPPGVWGQGSVCQEAVLGATG